MNKRLLLTQNSAGKTLAEVQNFDKPDSQNGDLEIKVSHSAINYKDALAVTGKAPIIRSFPLVPGIDACGEVISSDNPKFKVGDKLLATGWGLGEKHNGGHTTQMRLKSTYGLHLPSGMEASTAMILGTAGFTAMLCVKAITDKGIQPDAGPILVSGASGGVGGIAVKILSAKGYEVVAVSSEQGAPLAKSLGASKCIMRDEMAAENKPLEEQKWAAAVDTVGGKILGRILAETKYGGLVAACGLASGAGLSTTVMPFILRGITLAGIDSVYYPAGGREEVWQELSSSFKVDAAGLGDWMTEISLEQVPEYCDKLLKGEVKGKVLINLQK